MAKKPNPARDLAAKYGVEGGSPAVLKAYKPTLRNKLAEFVGGDAPQGSLRRNFTDTLVGPAVGDADRMTVADMLGVGQLLSGQEGGRDITTPGQRLKGAAEIAMSLIPGAPALKGAAKGAGKMAVKEAEKLAAKYEARKLTEHGLYSHAAETAAQLPQAKGTPQQMEAMLRKYGVKPDELKHSGFTDAFGDRPSVTRDEIVAHFQDRLPPLQKTVLKNEPLYSADWSPTKRAKFSEYTTPGGENYREVLMHLPTAAQKYYTALDALKAKYPTISGTDYMPLQPRERADFEALRDKAELTADDYKGSHWDEPNVLAHLRMSDRSLPEGGKALHLEELQSDWGQQGRKTGFYDPAKPYEVFNPTDGKVISTHATNEEARIAAETTNHLDYVHATGNGMPPAAPYVGNTNNWTDLGLKQALTEAAKGGHDKLIWTPGASQADRYDLSKQVKQIIAHEHPEGISLDIYDHKDNPILRPRGLTPDQIAEHIGKEPAQQILTNLANAKAAGSALPRTELQGLDLKVGGEGMLSYYDNILPKRLLALAREHNPEATLGTQQIGERKKDWSKLPVSQRLAWMGHDINSWETLTTGERTALLNTARNKTLPALDITPEMRESILTQGFKAYAKGGLVAKYGL